MAHLTNLTWTLLFLIFKILEIWPEAKFPVWKKNLEQIKNWAIALSENKVKRKPK